MNARLLEGYTVEDLKSAVDGCFGSKRNVEGGFIDLELICRNDQKVTQYMQWARTSAAHQGSEHRSLRSES